MKVVIDYLDLLKEEIIIFFRYYEKVSTPDSDEIIEHYHLLESIYLPAGNLQPHEFSKLFEDSHNNAMTYLTNYYYENIESKSALQAVYNELNKQLNEINARYTTVQIQGMNLTYSTRFILHVQVATMEYLDSGDTSPFYERFDVKSLTHPRHHQIIRALNTMADKERKSIESFRTLLKKFAKEEFPDRLPVSVLKQVFENFADYLGFDSEEEFVQAVTNLKKINKKEKYTNYISYLFQELLKIHKIKRPTAMLIKLCEVRNRYKEQLSNKPLLQKIDAFLKTFGENIELE